MLLVLVVLPVVSLVTTLMAVEVALLLMVGLEITALVTGVLRLVALVITVEIVSLVTLIVGRSLLLVILLRLLIVMVLLLLLHWRSWRCRHVHGNALGFIILLVRNKRVTVVLRDKSRGSGCDSRLEWSRRDLLRSHRCRRYETRSKGTTFSVEAARWSIILII
jgi:hypothetical protein